MILSLYNSHMLLTNKYDRIKNIEPEKTIDYLIELLYINNDQNIIHLLLDPYKK